MIILINLINSLSIIFLNIFIDSIFVNRSSNLEIDSFLEKIVLPEGFEINIYADDVENARSMAISPLGTIFVGNRNEDNVFALKDTDGDNDSYLDDYYQLSIMDLEALSGNVVTFTISNPNATANQVSNFVVKVIQGTTTTTRNFTWATIVTNGTNIDWAGGTGPDITTGADKVDIFSFTSYDNGTTWYGAIVGQEFS